MLQLPRVGWSGVYVVYFVCGAVAHVVTCGVARVPAFFP